MFRIKSLKPNGNVRKFSIELETFYGNKPIELAELHDAILHCFPELEELRVNINCQVMVWAVLARLGVRTSTYAVVAYSL